jgi:hypothetical protein
MDLAELLKAYALVAGSHTLGHYDAGAKNDKSVTADPSTFSEHWDQARKPFSKETIDLAKKYGLDLYDDYNEKQTNMNAGGFTMQDKIVNAADTPEMHTANALNKILYPLIVDRLPTGEKNFIKGGDLGGIEANSGNKYTKEITAASAIFDLLKARYPEKLKNLNMDLISPNGAFGAEFTYKW